ncbi:MAG: hypothetical protein KY395_07995, partial [Actinobacteria bacterium]|nr:hypothetical protein [Actinomycetota bacterium]
GWPELEEPDTKLLDEVSMVRRVVALGRQARVASKLRVRQPLRRLVVEGATLSPQFVAEVADELRVKELTFGSINATELRVRPNLPVLGPRLGAELGALRRALEAGEFETLPDGGFRAASHELSADEVLVEQTAKEGWAVASEGGVTVALDISLDDELILEGRVHDAIHRVNTMRKEAGFELTDRIHLRLPASDAELLAYRGRIMAETLAVSLDAGSQEDVRLTLAENA